jgi:hypothetical protein
VRVIFCAARDKPGAFTDNITMKRKQPEGAAAESAKAACTTTDAADELSSEVEHSPTNQEHPAHQLAREQELQATPPRRTIPKGSPAEAFQDTASLQPEDASCLTCDLLQVPKDRWNKRRTLSAIVLAVLPVKNKGATVRRDVVLRDENHECTVTVWGNHTNILNESAIGRPVTIQRVCLSEFEGKVQVAMPKDSSVALGNTAATAPLMVWLQRVGTAVVTVQQVRIPNPHNAQ